VSTSLSEASRARLCCWKYKSIGDGETCCVNPPQYRSNDGLAWCAFHWKGKVVGSMRPSNSEERSAKNRIDIVPASSALKDAKAGVAATAQVSSREELLEKELERSRAEVVALKEQLLHIKTDQHQPIQQAPSGRKYISTERHIAKFKSSCNVESCVSTSTARIFNTNLEDFENKNEDSVD
jgi:hypothetical protein